MNPIQLRSEQLILYALLMRPELVHDIMSNISADMFQDAKNKVIFEGAVGLYVEHSPIDTISVYKEILKCSSMYKQEAQMEVTKLIGKFSIVSPAEFNDAMMFMIAESVRDEHESLGSRVIEMSRADGYDPTNVLDFLQKHITDNKYKSLTKKKEYTNEDILTELDESMQKARDNEGVTGIETGYEEFDKLTGGMQDNNLIIVAARPGLGKSAHAIGILKHASVTNGYKGVLFSCEMSEVQLMKRLIATEGQIRGYSIKYGNLDPNEALAYGEARKRIAESNVSILAGSWGINDIVAKAHKLKNSTGLDYIIVDYVQKVHGSDKRNRNNEVEEVTSKLKDLATELNIPIIALAQLSRAVEQRPDKRPMLSDLRDSGAIEQDADIVVFLYRPSYYMDEAEKASSDIAGDAYMMIAKNRDGDLRDILMRWEENIPMFCNKMHLPIAPVIKQEEMEFDSPPSAIIANTGFDEECPF